MVTVYVITFTDTAHRQYKKLDNRIRRQVDKALHRIALRPESGKPLRGNLKGIWSERVATFRILYRIYKTEVEILVLTIEHRRTVYGDH